MKTMMRVSCVILLTFVFFAPIVFGQDAWQLPLTGSSVSLEYLSPSLSDFYSSTKVSMYSIIATGNFKLRNDNRIIIEIPYVHYHMDGYEIIYGNYYTYRNPGYNIGNIGNVYFAYEIKGKDEHLTTTFGVYLPTGSDKEPAPAAGMLYDYDRFGLYVPNILTFQPRFNYHSVSENLFLNIKGSPTITVLTKSEQGVHTVDLFVVLSVQGGFTSGNFSAAAVWAGNFIVTQSGDVSDRLIHKAGAVVGYSFAPVQLELFYRVPVSTNLSNILRYVIGVNVRYGF